MVLKKRNFQNSLLKLANTLMAVASPPLPRLGPRSGSATERLPTERYTL